MFLDQKFSDPHQQVKTALASIIMKLATLIGDEHTQTHLVPLFLGMALSYVYVDRAIPVSKYDFRVRCFLICRIKYF